MANFVTANIVAAKQYKSKNKKRNVIFIKNFSKIIVKKKKYNFRCCWIFY